MASAKLVATAGVCVNFGCCDAAVPETPATKAEVSREEERTTPLEVSREEERTTPLAHRIAIHRRAARR